MQSQCRIPQVSGFLATPELKTMRKATLAKTRFISGVFTPVSAKLIVIQY
jgi:hypothetical protein